MNLCIDHSNVIFDDLYFIKPVKNKMRKNSLFYKLFYDKHHFVINNFIIKYVIFVDLNNKMIQNDENKKVMDTIFNFETQLIQKLIEQNGNFHKQKNKSMISLSQSIFNNPNDKLKHCSKKKSYLSMESNLKMLNIRINGIWEDDDNFGFSFSYNIV